MKGIVFVSCFLGFLCLSMGQEDIPSDCGVCDRSACPEQKDKTCKAGITRDRCKCCQVCAQAEGEICDISGASKKYPPCGDYLTCKMDQDRNIGICVCDYQDTLCGTDDVTYTSICQMREAQNTKGRDLKVKNSGPCKTGDGRMDSPGHSAQYCSYTFMEYTTKKILCIITLDKRFTEKKSTNLEKACFIKGLGFLIEKGMKIIEVVTDAHVQISSLMTPRILTGPDSVTNVTGDKVVLMCEATGFPIPHIGWLFQRTDDETNSLPGDDMAISVVTRGGPEKYQVTGWLQVDEASKHHEGYYICVAHNKHGSDKQTGRIKIHEKKLNRVERKEDGDQL